MVKNFLVGYVSYAFKQRMYSVFITYFWEKQRLVAFHSIPTLNNWYRDGIRKVFASTDFFAIFEVYNLSEDNSL